MMLLLTLGSRRCAHVWLEDAAQRCQRGLQLSSVTLQFRLTAVSLSGHSSGATCGAYIQGLGATLQPCRARFRLQCVIHLQTLGGSTQALCRPGTHLSLGGSIAGSLLQARALILQVLHILLYLRLTGGTQMSIPEHRECPECCMACLVCWATSR